MYRPKEYGEKSKEYCKADHNNVYCFLVFLFFFMLYFISASPF